MLLRCVIEIIIRIETYNKKVLFYMTYKDVLKEVYCLLVSLGNTGHRPKPTMLIFKKNSPFYTKGHHLFSTTHTHTHTHIYIYIYIYMNNLRSFDVVQGRMNGVPIETRIHSCKFASLAC